MSYRDNPTDPLGLGNDVLHVPVDRPIPLQVPEDQQYEDNEADVHREPLPKKEGWNPPGPKYL